MSDSPEIASLTRWLGELQREVRDLATGNALNKGAVTDASGASVPLSNLAFGQLAATDSALVSFGGGGNTAGNTNGTQHTPFLTPYVSSGRLRVDWSADLGANPSGGTSATISMTITAQGPYASAAAAAAATPGVIPTGGMARGPGNDLAVDVGGNVSVDVNAGTFGIITGLAKGYWLVYPSYAFSWDALGFPSAGPGGTARRRSVGVTPF